MWGRYNWRTHWAAVKQREAEQKLFNFEEHVWGANDENRDKVITYAELVGAGELSSSAVDALFASIGKDPTQEDLTYDELRATYMTEVDAQGRFKYQWWALSRGNGGDYDETAPVIIDNIDITDGEVSHSLGVDTQEELEALFAAIDQNGDSELTELEACKYFYPDSVFACQEAYHPITDPDYV